MNKNIFYIIVGLIFSYILIIQPLMRDNESKIKEVTYTEFVNMVEDGSVKTVAMQGQDIVGTSSLGEFKTVIPPVGDPKLVDSLIASDVKIIGMKPKQENIFQRLFFTLLPILLLFFLLTYVSKSMMGGSGKKGNNPFSFGKSKAKILNPEDVVTRFSDVAGNEEAIGEVKEIVDFLRNPQKYWKLGGQIPKGVLMLGPPGTGKTLIAKAVAGEAGVPFFTISGSDFVEMFVGVGASRVRDMFEEARKNAPCIIFIDEIDAMGRSRSNSGGNGNDEREQTLNQMLVEMDGMDSKSTVIVMAATNRADVLDSALLRPGRFDRQVTVGLPDVKGREAILKVHINKKKVGKDIDVSSLAKGTSGFSGADLANLCNEAALSAARNGHESIKMIDFEEAKDKILMGATKQGAVMDEKEKSNTAYHEAGHAIVGWVMGEEEAHDPVYKVSIIPRGRALGVTMYLPEKDRYSLSKKEAFAQICSLYGGRIAEHMTVGEEGVTTGASNDIERATELAYSIVTRWGLSDMGPLLYTHKENDPYQSRQMSEETFNKIDAAVKNIADTCYKRAEQILLDNKDKLELMHNALIHYETIDAKQIEMIMKGIDIVNKDDSNQNDSLDNLKNQKDSFDRDLDELLEEDLVNN